MFTRRLSYLAILRDVVIICMPLWLSMASPAQQFGLPVLSDEEFAKKVEASRQDSIRSYPDLTDPNSIFSRAAKVVDVLHRRESPNDFEGSWNYPLDIARETAGRLRVFSPMDPLFSEVVPVFIAKNDDRYLDVRVAKLQRDGIRIVHNGGADFIHRDNLTEPQQDKYHVGWRTEVFVPTELNANVDAALQERDHNLEIFTSAARDRHNQLLAAAKSDFQREYVRGCELNQARTIRYHCEQFTLRLFELAYAAKEFGQRDAMERIEKELSDPVPEPYKTQLKEMDEMIKERNARFEPMLAMLRGKRCQLLRDGQVLLEGVPKRGQLGSAEFELPTPEHVRIVLRNKDRSTSQWVFKLDPTTGNASLLPEASNDQQGGIVSFHIVK
ncbi:MAG: hypothetical protein V4727_03605 [Verrucomicrobiota bacterium]